MVGRLNLDGDAQGDLAGHGGEHRAVMVYQTDSYRYWQRYLGRNDFSYGQFGENFTIEGLSDSEVCVGDRYRIGSALFEVTQPRVTCYRVGIRMEEARMPALLVSHHRPGFYFRVLEEGEVGADDEIFPIAREPGHVTVADIDALLYLPEPPLERLKRAVQVPALSTGWKRSLEALLNQRSELSTTGNAGLTPFAGSPPAWQGFRSLQVAKVNRESNSVRSFFFKATDGSRLPPGLPGQYLVLKLRPEANAQPILRNYSISGRPGADTYRVSVKQEMNGVASSFLHSHVREGDVLEASVPRGTFTLQPGERPVVLMSAGIGATPVLAMLHSLADARSSREIWWLYGARNRDEHPFEQESRELLKQLPRNRTYIVYSRPGADDRIGAHFNAPGHLAISTIEALGVPRDADYYLCGPPAFLGRFIDALRDRGTPAAQIHIETFGPEKSLRPGIADAEARPVHPPPNAPKTGLQVSFARSGLTVNWDSRFQSLLEFAEACDVPVRWSCRTGVCHTCECGLIGGAVEYQPDPLEAPANGNLLVCCSTPRSDIQLDL
jgi:ferredoxin-NADP reductase/MOSC domain-containing protein YiiM